MNKQYTFLLALSFLFQFTLAGQTLTNIEGVEYDPINDQFLISNGSSIIAQNYDSGELSFFGSGTATHGMEVIGENIFVIDGATIRGYSLVDASEVMSLPITGAQFLNGLTSDKQGTLYATDFSTRQILSINVNDLGKPSFEVLVTNTQLTPNGIHFDSTNNRLVFVTWGNNASVRALALDDLSISILASTSYGNMDGIVQDTDDNYYISTWSPARIIKFDSSFANPPEEITLPTSLRNPADIGIARDKGIIGVPHYPASGDEIVYITLEDAGSVNTNDALDLSKIKVSISPNPVASQAHIEIELIEAAKVKISLYSLNGIMIKTISNSLLSNDNHVFISDLSRIAKGQYFIDVNVNGQRQSYPLIIQ